MLESDICELVLAVRMREEEEGGIIQFDTFNHKIINYRWPRDDGWKVNIVSGCLRLQPYDGRPPRSGEGGTDDQSRASSHSIIKLLTATIIKMRPDIKTQNMGRNFALETTGKAV